MRDKVAQISGPVMEARNDGVALRYFDRYMKEQNADDFELLYLGVIDHETDLIAACQPSVVTSNINTDLDEDILEVNSEVMK